MFSFRVNAALRCFTSVDVVEVLHKFERYLSLWVLTCPNTWYKFGDGNVVSWIRICTWPRCRSRFRTTQRVVVLRSAISQLTVTTQRFFFVCRNLETCLAETLSCSKYSSQCRPMYELIVEYVVSETFIVKYLTDIQVESMIGTRVPGLAVDENPVESLEGPPAARGPSTGPNKKNRFIVLPEDPVLATRTLRGQVRSTCSVVARPSIPVHVFISRLPLASTRSRRNQRRTWLHDCHILECPEGL